MKYVVFSFDDGLLDFKYNALPILEKFGFKCTINIISGFSDGSIKTTYNYLSDADIENLHKNGFEIANHTNSHMRGGSYDELLMCDQKINKWCNTSLVAGIAMPKYVKPSKDAKKFFNEFKVPYITYEKRCYRAYFRFGSVLSKLRYLFKKEDINFYRYSHKLKMYPRNKTRFFRRFQVGPTINPNKLFYSLYSIKSDCCLTICFHSIVQDIRNCEYPKGSWTPEQFYIFCKLLYENQRDFCVVTQIEACKRLK